MDRAREIFPRSVKAPKGGFYPLPTDGPRAEEGLFYLDGFLYESTGLEGQSSIRKVRFRRLGCWPVTGAIESDASDLRAVLDETLRASSSERQGRISDGEDAGSIEQKKREGYF